QWCVSVGLIHEGVSQMGAVYLPVLDELYWGVRGQGSFCNGIRLSTVDRDSLHVEDTICVTSNAAKSLNIEAINGRIRCFGSIATELCYTARGNITATLGLKEGIVDIAAALCICSEAGCVFEYLDGEPVNVVELLDTTRTYKHFVYGPPRLVKHLQTILHVTA
ncbi:MAG: inositol monophosphatase family protein, partial [Chthonomonadales bacterium]